MYRSSTGVQWWELVTVLPDTSPPSCPPPSPPPPPDQQIKIRREGVGVVGVGGADGGPVVGDIHVSDSTGWWPGKAARAGVRRRASHHRPVRRATRASHITDHVDYTHTTLREGKTRTVYNWDTYQTGTLSPDKWFSPRSSRELILVPWIRPAVKYCW